MTPEPLLMPSVALAGALIALVLYHALAVAPALKRLRELAATHDDLLGGPGGAASSRMAALEAGLTSLSGRAEGISDRVSELEERSRSDVSRVGFVRYDAFEDTGSDLSYALALLNREGSGVVLSSLYSRTDTRTYGKAVERFQPAATASEEELKAIALVRDSLKAQ